MAKIYLTSRFCRQEEMKTIRDWLQKVGHTVTSRWLDEEVGAQSPEQQAKCAEIDLEDIDASDYLFAYTEPNTVGYYTGGRHIEVGYAIARKIQVICIGPKENIFFELSTILHAINTGDAETMIA